MTRSGSRTGWQGFTLVHNSAQPEPVLFNEAKLASTSQLILIRYCELNTQHSAQKVPTAN